MHCGGGIPMTELARESEQDGRSRTEMVRRRRKIKGSIWVAEFFWHWKDSCGTISILSGCLYGMYDSSDEFRPIHTVMPVSM